jgi:glutamyl-tRNA synthetase
VIRTRLAPSPTGALHLGNARTFLINWILARQNGWQILLRIEDLDGPRIKRGADAGAIDDLQWLGLDWDEGPVYQSARLERYQSAIAKLVNDGHAYPCTCTRKEAASAASAPHAEDGSSVYPGTCRGKYSSIEAAQIASGKSPAVRFNVGRAVVQFDDSFAGPQRYAMERLGDFVIAKADGTPAYQLAVVVDDAEMGVTHIVRGDDLLESTPRQILLYDALSLKPRPTYFHLPLIVGEDGRRLAKRHGDTRLEYYRIRGVRSGRVLAMLARWCGVADVEDELTARELVSRFDLTRLPRDPIVFRPTDDAFLLNDT